MPALASWSTARDLAGRRSAQTTGGKQVADDEAVARVLSALAGEGGEPARRAWAALAGMTTRICGRYSAEGRAVEAARAAGKPDPASLGGVAGLLASRARHDARFASGFVPWLAAAQMLLPGRPGGQ
jgi:hypothetical protein